MKRYIIIFLVLGAFFAVFLPVLAEDKIEMLFFYSPTCSACARAKPFLNDLAKECSEIKFTQLSITEEENTKKLWALSEEYGVPEEKRGLIPIVFIKEEYFVGYRADGKTGEQIRNYVLGLKKDVCTDDSRLIRVPFLGVIDAASLSPLGLAVLLGILDGFNACAMVALGFLLAMLVATGVRERVLLVGGVFILVSGLVYFIFIAAWLNLFLVLGQIKIITIGVGAVVVLFGLFLIKDYLSGVVCKICRVEEGETGFLTRIERFLLEKMQKVSEKEMSLPILLLAVGIIAAGINLVELVCSLGLPLAFTRALTGMQMPTASYYFYILIYMIFYMADDFVLFLIASFTLRTTGVQDKYLRSVKLISALVLILLGLTLVFKPELLAI